MQTLKIDRLTCGSKHYDDHQSYKNNSCSLKKDAHEIIYFTMVFSDLIFSNLMFKIDVFINLSRC